MEVFLKKQFDDAGFKTEVLYGQVLSVENFLSQNELDAIWEIINRTEEKEWFKAYRDSLVRFCLEKFGRDDVENLVAEGKYEITKDWDDKNLDIIKEPVSREAHKRVSELLKLADSNLELAGFGTMQRMQAGVQLKSHTDQHTDPSIRYAAILYINDDYKDGTLFFENIENSDIRPKPGTLLIFPGNDQFQHGVRHVTEGPIRYVIVGFIKVKGFYENNKY